VNPEILVPAWPAGLAGEDLWDAWADAPDQARRLARGGMWRAVRGWLALFHRLTIHGQEHWPTAPPCVLVANHASHLDTLVLAAAAPPHLRESLHPLAAADVFFRTRLRAYLATTLMRAMPFSRRHWGLHQLRELRGRLENDRSVYVLYPEGTRSRTGAMGAFRHGVGALTAGGRVPVVPCHLDGTFAALRPGQVLPRPRKLVLRIGRPLSFADVDNSRSGWEHVSKCVEAAVRRLAKIPEDSCHANSGD
jgi:1-acyl-sn-glycerol-3-phosphate acyltransferase